MFKAHANASIAIRMVSTRSIEISIRNPRGFFDDTMYLFANRDCQLLIDIAKLI